MNFDNFYKKKTKKKQETQLYLKKELCIRLPQNRLIHRSTKTQQIQFVEVIIRMVQAQNLHHTILFDETDLTNYFLLHPLWILKDWNVCTVNDVRHHHGHHHEH